MRNIFLIARREYMEQIRGRAFRITTLLLPVVFVAIIGISYISTRGAGAGKHLAIAADNAALANAIRDRVLEDKDAKATVDVAAPASNEEKTALRAKVQSKDIDGLLIIDNSTSGAPTAAYISQSSGDFITIERLKSALNHSLVNQRLTDSGIKQVEVDSLLKSISVDTVQIDKQGNEVKSNGAGSIIKGYIMATLLLMTTMIYGLNVARSVIQEKTSRIFEVMLAIAKPGDLLAGKLIGVGAVGLTQIAIWVICAGALVSYPAAMAMLSGQLSVHLSWEEAVLFPIYFVLGYLLNSALFSGLAATCETEQDLQMYTPLAALPTWISFSIIWYIISNPNSILSIAVSLFPLTSPVVMFLRMSAQIPPLWQIAASILIMILSIWGVLWFSTRLYRVGILMYGKRATLPELFRWLRYS